VCFEEVVAIDRVSAWMGGDCREVMTGFLLESVHLLELIMIQYLLELAMIKHLLEWMRAVATSRLRREMKHQPQWWGLEDRCSERD
jgi:hypothetical protein